MSAENPPACPKCGEVPHLVWIGFDPPEPYGDVCGCPDGLEQLSWAREEKAADDADAFDRLAERNRDPA